MRHFRRNDIFCLLFQQAGTAFLSKYEAISVDNTLPGHPDPSHVKGRIVTLEFESCYLVGTYVVNAGDGLKVSTRVACLLCSNTTKDIK